VTKFAFVSAERGTHAVATLCLVIGASVSGFYAWLHEIPPSRTEPRPKPSYAHPFGEYRGSARSLSRGWW
jgi:hypothetical protein